MGKVPKTVYFDGETVSDIEVLSNKHDLSFSETVEALVERALGQIDNDSTLEQMERARAEYRIDKISERIETLEAQIEEIRESTSTE